MADTGRWRKPGAGILTCGITPVYLMDGQDHNRDNVPGRHTH
ncbi:TPA: hypothetical protein ACIVB1_001839 [Salmonella enterica subsp. diarizonae serovar 61:l,v:z35]